jgi:anti-anti-sigma factor
MIFTRGNYTVIEPTNDSFDSVFAPEIRTEILNLSKQGVKNLIFDLKNCYSIDSTGLSVLAFAFRMVRGEKSNFYVLNAKHAILKLLKVSELIIPVVSDFEELEDL